MVKIEKMNEVTRNTQKAALRKKNMHCLANFNKAKNDKRKKMKDFLSAGQ